MKRIISVLLLVCLMASFCTLSAFAAEVTVSNQTEFEGAMTTAASGDTIVLGAGDFTMVEPTATITIKYSAGTNLTFPSGLRYEDRVTYDTGSTGGSGGGAGGGIMLLSSPVTVSTLAELQDALADPNVSEIIFNNPITIPAGTSVTLDLNGKTLSYVDENTATSNTEMIHNYGNLTVKDSAGGGKITYKYSGASLGTTYAVNTITSEPGSVFTLESGTVENLTTTNESRISYAIDGRTNGSLGDVTVKVKGGTVKAGVQAIRIFANSTTHRGTLDISGGTFEGRVIIHSANSKANKASVNVSAGTFNTNGVSDIALYLYGAGGDGIDEVSVSGGTFNGELSNTSKNTGFITGGNFAIKPADEDIDPDFVADPNGNGFVVRDPNAPTGGGAAQGAVSNPYAIPATGDMSNMPLWAVLFLGFAAVAVLTRKKKA